MIYFNFFLNAFCQYFGGVQDCKTCIKIPYKDIYNSNDDT